MRLDARKGDLHWQVWHAEECRLIPHVVWVDDENHQYGCYATGADKICLPLTIITVQARKIVIAAHARVIVINPVEDQEPDAIPRAVSTPETATS